MNSRGKVLQLSSLRRRLRGSIFNKKEKEDVFLFYTQPQIQEIAKRIVYRHLSPKEIRCLKAKTITAAHNLIIKIDSSFIGK